MNKLNYIVEEKDWDNMDSYPTLYAGNSFTNAMIHFKEALLQGKDVILFIEDQTGNTIDVLENYGQLDNIIKCNELFKPENKELVKENKEATRLKEIYHNQYQESLTKNTELEKTIKRLQVELNAHKQQLNNFKEDSKQSTKEANTLYWYAYKLRGFSPFCQPKGHLKVDTTIGRHGIIAYDRQLTDIELEEYELLPYKHEKKAL